MPSGRNKLLAFALAVSATAASTGAAITDIITTIQSINRQDNELSNQIEEVEGAIRDLRTLEDYLNETKEEMIATQQSKDRIEEEYRKAQELEKLTSQQIEAISSAVNKRTARDIIKDYIVGFTLGIASSIVASYIFQFLTKKRATARNIQEDQ